MGVEGLRFVITGSAAGIGAGTARLAASRGAKVVAAAPDPKAMLNTMTMTHLVPRMGQPADVAELVCFLASPESRFVNGAVWTIDGGSLAWRGTLDVLGMEVNA